jgi:hypothetical protein
MFREVTQATFFVIINYVSDNAKSALLNSLAIFCIFGAGYGYLTANLTLLFIFVGLGLLASGGRLYFKIKEGRNSQNRIAIEALSRIDKNKF